MKQRLFYLIRVYLLTVTVFVVAKMVFMWANSGGHPFTAADVWDVVRHGLSLDLSTSLYLLILPFLVATASIFTESQWLKTILRSYYALVAVALMLAFTADTSLYPFWGFKLDASCLQYLATPDEARASVSGLYLAVRLVIIVVGAGVLWWIFSRIPLWRERPKKPLAAIVVHLLLIPLFVIGIRGGIDESTTNIGQVYFSQNQFLNHSAVNPVFSFLASFERTANEIVEYEWMDTGECETLLADIFPTESLLSDTLLRTTRPNVVIILLESCSQLFSPVMPHLNRLKDEGIWFSNCYGNSYRTDRGTVCTLSGYPSFPTMSVMKMPKKTAHLPSIAKTLRQEGYQTSYLYGGDINFTNMRSYLIATGWEKLHWKADYSVEEQATAKWGVRDDITFKTLYDQICAADTTRGKRFLMGFSTLSTHEPWDVPVRNRADEVENAFSYLDECIGRLVSDLKTTPFWDNLLLVMLPDHGINHRDIDEMRPERNHIPMLWVGGAVKEPRVVSPFCNQTDLAATLLGQMNLPHADFAFSRDVLSRNYVRQFAFHTFNNGFSVVDSVGFTVFDLNVGKTLVGHNDEAVRLGKAILQSTSKDLKEKK